MILFRAVSVVFGIFQLGLSTPTETFRLGLFGLDKIQHIDRTVERLTAAIDGFETVARL